MQQTQLLQQTQVLRLMQCQRTPCVQCALQTRLLQHCVKQMDLAVPVVYCVYPRLSRLAMSQKTRKMRKKRVYCNTQ
jgi:hypothetical protein